MHQKLTEKSLDTLPELLEYQLIPWNLSGIPVNLDHNIRQNKIFMAPCCQHQANQSSIATSFEIPLTASKGQHEEWRWCRTAAMCPGRVSFFMFWYMRSRRLANISNLQTCHIPFLFNLNSQRLWHLFIKNNYITQYISLEDIFQIRFVKVAPYCKGLLKEHHLQVYCLWCTFKWRVMLWAAGLDQLENMPYGIRVQCISY